MGDAVIKMFMGIRVTDPMVMGTFFLGAAIVLIGFIIGRRSRTCENTNEPKSDEIIQEPEIQKSINTNNERNIGGNKRAKNKKRREAQQEFTHSWVVGTLKGHTGPVLDINFSSDDKFLASCAEDRTVQIWCTKDLSSKERKSLRVNIDYDFATNVRVSPDGKAFIIHKSQSNNVEVYGLRKKPNGFFASATLVLEFPKRHEEDIVGMEIACSGRFIMTCGKTNDLIVWDLKGEVLATVDTYLGSTHMAKISPCGRFVAASGFTPDVKVWEVGFTKTGEFKQITSAFNLGGHSSGVYDFDFNADSSLMASVSKDGTYRLYDTKIEFEKGEDPHFILSGTWENVTPTKMVMSPNGEVIVITHGSSLSFYSGISGKLDTTIEDIGFVSCLTFDASGEYLLVAVDRYIRIIRNIPGYRSAIESAKRKLEQRQTSATKERLEKVIADSEKFLKSMGERVL
ncbi:transducin beta-like protein 2 isoform X3 [Microplitis demolitor]|uniref:transducin beta-like protein 2 isoform X3 n=1 Tax=Microplitis demolitor TaxID=69319 RepID=UPI0006D4E93F|nr:transducin beta-like protein 2 isoform X3 [Microplitis demolitor]